ncbi:MAG TPA: tRNA (N(6)-L-threonylcarbamoyladenosine(37)-C(2))-methylthiotransferase MtaB [Stellaceae bacterium]|nr:tRNA (N(6)-L-threonylcarbamoyladenosine(37)-C(2))-methylthiotransferase MtaB [Stellaceae bacterium]
MPDLAILTFGCRLNAYESEIMRREALNAGLADAVIVNTCAVTAEAERQARQAIRRARRERPDARIIVTGCAAQIAPERYAAMPEVDLVLGNEEKLRGESYAAAFQSLPRPHRLSLRSEEGRGAAVAVGDIMAVRETAAHLLDGFAGRARAVLQVQQGCDHRCTFCIIPYGRGNSRSVPIGAVVEAVRTSLAGGCREIVLSGVDLTAFGADLPGRPGLGQLVRRLLALVPELPRLRLSSLDPIEIDDELWRLIAEEERLMPHLHLSIQAGDDLVLKRMKRRHSRADALAACERARRLRPGLALGADLIAGFPTETEAMFEKTLAFVTEAKLSHLHVFPYSPRPGTPAARMPQVPRPIIRERAARLRAVGKKQHEEWLEAQIGTTARVLLEREGCGHSENYAKVRLASGGEDGAIVSARLTGRSGDALLGEALAP